jgi:hypothetical protein
MVYNINPSIYIGISLSMYLLTSMTSNISQEVYANMSVTYKNNLEYKFEDKQKELRKIILGLKTNDTFKNNLNNKQVIDSIIDNYNKNLVESGFDSISLTFYSTVNQTNQYRNIINSVINRKIQYLVLKFFQMAQILFILNL